MISDFSAGYYLVDAQVLPFSGERVTVGEDVAAALTRYATAPILKLGAGHYHVQKQRTIPAEVIAIPDYVEMAEDEEPLLAKDERALELMLDPGPQRRSS